MNPAPHIPTKNPAFALSLAALLALTGCCATAGNPPAASSVASTQSADLDADAVVHFSQEKTGVPQPGQTLFGSAEAAAAAFKDAVAAKDRRTLVALFGPEGKQLIFSGDRVQENNDLTAFAARLSEYLHVDHPSDTTAVLHVGKENWPFPIPVVNSGAGWFFDTVAGRDELLNRRIGEDELNAIAVCQAYVAAQKEYARKNPTGDKVVQYAQHFMSSPGKKDGLYWEVAPGKALSPMGPLVAEARQEGYPATQPTPGHPHPYQGYIFHILTAQGPAAPGGKMEYVVDGKMTKGFALIAYPSKYGSSGIMTFLVAKDGKVFQKNLGPTTRDLAQAIAEYNPDKSWEEVKE